MIGGTTILFCSNLKNLRIKYNMSQESLAVLLHVSRQAISRWENGIAEPDINTLKRISAFFHITVDTLIS